MEYIHFDNERIDMFFKEGTGKEQYTFDDIMSFLEDETEVESESFEYMLRKKQYEYGLVSEKPQMSTIKGYENRRKLNDIFNDISNIDLLSNKNSISIQDFEILTDIEKKLDIDNKRRAFFDTIGIKHGSFYIFGSRIKTNISSEFNLEGEYDGISCDFQNTSENDFKKKIEWLKRRGCNSIKKRISSFRGITPEKLEILGEEDYYIKGDLGNPYNSQEILQILSRMEKINEKTKDSNQDIDIFLPVYKSIAMYVDADKSGCLSSEECIEENVDFTRSLRGVLLNGVAVCAGYSLALFYCSDFVGLDALICGRIWSGK